MTDTTQWAHDAAAWKGRAERAERQAEALAKALERIRNVYPKARDPSWASVDAALAAYREGR